MATAAAVEAVEASQEAVAVAEKPPMQRVEEVAVVVAAMSMTMTALRSCREAARCCGRIAVTSIQAVGEQAAAAAAAAAQQTPQRTVMMRSPEHCWTQQDQPQLHQRSHQLHRQQQHCSQPRMRGSHCELTAAVVVVSVAVPHQRPPHRPQRCVACLLLLLLWC